MLMYWARSSPERPALVQSNMVITYQALAEAVAGCCERIQLCGLGPAEPVAVAIADPSRQLVVCLALLHNGITCAPVGQDMVPSLPANNINHLIFSAGSQILANGQNIAFDDSWLRWARALPPRTVAPSARMIFFTSGTTGTPKKVVVPIEAVLDRIGLASVTGETRLRKVLIAPGLGSKFGFERVGAVLATGKTTIFAGDFFHPLRLIETFRVDTVVASPQQAMTLVDMIDAQPGYRLESVKEIRIGGGALSPDLARRIQSHLCRNVVTEYGATEAGLIAWAPYDTINDTPGAVGFVVPGTRIEIVDENDRMVPIGEEGLIRAQSNYISLIAKANMPNETDHERQAWWYPGDLGRITQQGVLCVGGRTDDIINCGGVKLSAAMLDNIVLRYPGVRDAGVCAVRGEAGIDEAWIGVTSDVAIDVVGLKRFVEESQNYQLKVGDIRKLEKIPRNNLGKLQRNDLKALLIGAASSRPSDEPAQPDGPNHGQT